MVDNRTATQKLDEILELRAQREAHPNRELYEEEKQKIEEWNNRVQKQDEKLGGIRTNLNILKMEAVKVGEGLENLGRNIKQTDKMAEKTESTLKTTNAKLKDLLQKLRSGDRICIDIVLVCICLGLIAVLYNIVKNKFFDSSSSSSSSTTTNTTK